MSRAEPLGILLEAPCAASRRVRLKSGRLPRRVARPRPGTVRGNHRRQGPGPSGRLSGNLASFGTGKDA